MIVVIDTNVCVSAFLFASKRGTPAQALGKAISADVIATCDEIDAEFLRILTEKFQWKPPLAFEALETMRKRIVRVKIYGTVSLCRDPDDNKILECAARAKAATEPLAITRNRHQP